MWIIDHEQVHGSASHRAADACGEDAATTGIQLPFMLLASAEANG